MRYSPPLLAAAALVTAISLSGCSGGFSEACKAAINRTIDARQALPGGAPCASPDDDATRTACADLNAATSSLIDLCGDDQGDALNQALMMQRQS
jgi:hypothetical protein